MKKIFLPILGLIFLLALLPGSVLANPVDFELPDLDGNAIKLSDYRGKWVVVNYWATWCPPCVAEMPELELFHNSHKDKDAIVLGVNMQSIDIRILKKFVEDHFISYPIVTIEPTPRTELGKVTGLPTTYLVSPGGEVVARQAGTVSKEMLESFIEEYKKN